MIRPRKEIEDDLHCHRPHPYNPTFEATALILEVLLDVRELLRPAGRVVQEGPPNPESVVTATPVPEGGQTHRVTFKPGVRIDEELLARAKTVDATGVVGKVGPFEMTNPNVRFNEEVFAELRARDCEEVIAELRAKDEGSR